MKPPYHTRVGSPYGAQLGRRDYIPADASTVTRMSLRRVTPTDGGDYDRGGAYWGDLAGKPLYCAYGESDTEQVEMYVRAPDREAAKPLVLVKFPNARFR